MISNLSNHDKTKFFDEYANRLVTQHFKRQKQINAYIFVPSNSKILEFTSEYGVVSCLINSILDNPQHHLVIQTNKAFIPALVNNKNNHKSKFQLLELDYSLIPLNLETLNQKYSIKFDMMIGDYSDVNRNFIKENNMEQFKTILLEKYPSDKYLYDDIDSKLTQFGFLKICDTNETVVYINMKFLSFTILSYNVGQGYIGLFNKLGYITTYQNVETTYLVKIKDIYKDAISVHAPSNVVIQIKKEMIIKGYISMTAKICPNVTFKLDKKIIGTVTVAGGSTIWVKISPGKHELEVETNDTTWAHSIWIFKDITIINKYLKIDFNTTGWGLFNQLINLTNGLIIANQIRRHIFDPRFMISYNSLESIPLSSIIDIGKFNEMLRFLGLDTQIIAQNSGSLPNDKWIVSKSHSRTTRISTLYPTICESLSRYECRKLDIGKTFNLTLEMPEYIRNIVQYIYGNLPLVPVFQDIINYCKILLRNDYGAIHLRLEDDWIRHSIKHIKNSKGKRKFRRQTRRLYKAYMGRMAKVFKSDDVIYVATHLLKSKNRNNNLMLEIRSKYPNMISNIDWRQKFKLPNGREIDALVDYMICINSNKFIGMSGSTFSSMVSQIMSYKNKPIIML